MIYIKIRFKLILIFENIYIRKGHDFCGNRNYERNFQGTGI